MIYQTGDQRMSCPKTETVLLIARCFLLLYGLCLTIAGCAVGNVGSLAAHVTQADGASVIDLYTVGLSLRTAPDDRGLQLGIGKRTYVFPDPPCTLATESLQPGWYYFVVPLPDTAAVAIDSRHLGVDVPLGPAEFGITIGLQHTVLMAYLPSDRSLTMRLSYFSGQPARTYLRIHTQGEPCERQY